MYIKEKRIHGAKMVSSLEWQVYYLSDTDSVCRLVSCVALT